MTSSTPSPSPAAASRPSTPDWQEVERTGDRLCARGVVPRRLVWLDGHFPGQPLVAGFVQLDWVLALARERLGLRGAPAAVEALKFRTPLPPDTRLEARLEAAPGRLRFALASPRGDAFAEGRVVWGEPAQHAPEAGVAAASGPPLRLPQAGRMRLLERVLSHAPEATTSEAVVRDETPLCRGGRVPAWIALEWLAQGMAAHGGLVAGEARLRGLLLGTRRLLLRTRAFAVGERLWVRAAVLRAGTGLVAFDCALGSGAPPADDAEARARALARAPLNAFVSAAPAGD